MDLEPYVCLHCRKHTDVFSMMSIRFQQQQLHQSYGVYYDRGTQEVDHGKVPVFVCRKCIKNSLFETRLYWYRLICALLAVLFSLLTIATGNDSFVTLLILLLIPYAAAPFIRYKAMKARSARRHENYITTAGGLSKDVSIDMSLAGGEFSLQFLLPLVFYIVVLILLLAVPEAGRTTLAWIFLCFFGALAAGYAGMILYCLRRTAKASAGAIQLAAEYYLYYDHNISLSEP